MKGRPSAEWRWQLEIELQIEIWQAKVRNPILQRLERKLNQLSEAIQIETDGG